MKNMNDYYNVTLNIEAINEYAAAVLADYASYMQKSGIDRHDKNNKIACERAELVMLSKKIVLCSSASEIEAIYSRFKEAKALIECLRKGEKTMSMKRIVKLSEMYNTIGEFLVKNGDMDVVSIATHSGNPSCLFSLNVKPLDSNEWDTVDIPIKYEMIENTPSKDALFSLEQDERE